MQHNRFANICLVVIVFLLGVIALRIDPTPAHAARTIKYEVVPVFEGTPDQHVAAQIGKETQAGWELVAAPMWQASELGSAQGYLIFRR
jgi:hypothetical protein